MIGIYSYFQLLFHLYIIMILTCSQMNEINSSQLTKEGLSANQLIQKINAFHKIYNQNITQIKYLRYLSYDDPLEESDIFDSDFKSILEESEKDLSNQTYNPNKKEDSDSLFNDNEMIKEIITNKKTKNTEILTTREISENFLIDIRTNKYSSNKIKYQTILNITEEEMFIDEFSYDIRTNQSNLVTESPILNNTQEELFEDFTDNINNTTQNIIIIENYTGQSTEELYKTEKSKEEIIYEETEQILETIKTQELTTNLQEIQNYSSDNYINIIPKSISLEDLLTLTKEKFIETLDKFMLSQKIGINYKYPGKNYTLIIKPINSSIYNDMTNINFENCEKVLRNKNKINESSILTLLQIEIENDNPQSLNNQVEYRIYDETKTPLDLSVCKDINISINQSMKEDFFYSLNKELILKLKSLGVNPFDINDPFFSDLCFPFSYQDIDITLKDRNNIIYQNFSLCEEGCNNTYIDFDNKFATCQCKVKTDIDNKIHMINIQQKKELKSTISNINVLKCSAIIFKFSNKSKNIGFIIFGVFVSLYLIIIITHMIKGINSVSNFIYKDMINKNYLKEGDKKFFEDNKNNNQEKSKTFQLLNTQSEKKNPFNNGIINNIQNNDKRKNNLLNKKKQQILRKSSRRINNSSMRFFPNQNKRKSLKSNPIKKRIIKKNNQGILKLNVNNINGNNKSTETIDDFGIIKIKLDDLKENYYPKSSSKTLHNLTYKDLMKYENRHFFQILYIFLLTKQIVFHTFLERSPLVPFQITFSIFIFTVCFDLSINALFYTNSTLSQNSSSKNFLSLSISNNTLIIIISTLSSVIFIPFIIKWSKSDRAIRKIFSSVEVKLRKNKNFTLDFPSKRKIFSEVEDSLRYYRIKLVLLLLFQFIVIIFFWYFITAFCQVYQKSQIYFLFNSLTSVLIRFVFEVLICSLFAKLYNISYSIESYSFYKFIMFVYDFNC